MITLVLMVLAPSVGLEQTPVRHDPSSSGLVAGLFEFLNVLPGDYFVGVLVGISGDELDDPAFLDSLRAASSSVSVLDGETARITLRIG